LSAIVVADTKYAVLDVTAVLALSEVCYTYSFDADESIHTLDTAVS